MLGFERGGYYATAWGWATIAALAAASAAIVRTKSIAGSRLDALLLGGLAGLALWTLAEASRHGAATHGVPSLERCVLYLAAAWAAIQLISRRTADAALAGVLAAIVVVLGSALVALLLPHVVRADEFEGRLLFLPLGYANACGILAAVGTLLALGLAGHATPLLRGAAAAALVPLVVALALTGSRGAVLAACGGLVIFVALDATGRGAVLSVLYLPVPLAAAAIASRTDVGDVRATTSLVAHDGRLVALTVAGLTAVQPALAATLHRQTESPRARRHAYRGLLGCAGAGILTIAFMGLGGALGDRPAYWHVAWADIQAHPLAGSGPGSFASVWLARRTTVAAALNAHNLYLETLAELGPLGLIALLGALAAPLAVLRRRLPTTIAAAGGAYVAFLLHAGLDWDWQMPAVTVTGLICGGCLLAARRDPRAPSPRSRRSADVALVCSALLALGAGAAAIGNHAVASAARSERAGEPPGDAARLARIAIRWQPWSGEPHRLLGFAYLEAEAPAAARREFKRAVALDPTDIPAWLGLVRVGNPAERARALQKLARLDPLL